MQAVTWECTVLIMKVCQALLRDLAESGVDVRVHAKVQDCVLAGCAAVQPHSMYSL